VIGKHLKSMMFPHDHTFNLDTGCCQPTASRRSSQVAHNPEGISGATLQTARVNSVISEVRDQVLTRVMRVGVPCIISGELAGSIP
jgi:hypothetical protein